MKHFLFSTFAVMLLVSNIEAATVPFDSETNTVSGLGVIRVKQKKDKIEKPQKEIAKKASSSETKKNCPKRTINDMLPPCDRERERT